MEEVCIQVPEFISCYKGIYLLSKSSNTAFGKFYIPFFKLLLVLVFILAFFAIVRLHQNLDLFSVALLMINLLTVPALTVPVSIVMSSLYDISSQFNRHLSFRIQLVANKKSIRVFERQLKSCLLVRCQVGNFYDMEAKAKLTLIHNVLNGIVFLMVNGK